MSIENTLAGIEKALNRIAAALEGQYKRSELSASKDKYDPPSLIPAAPAVDAAPQQEQVEPRATPPAPSPAAAMPPPPNPDFSWPLPATAPAANPAIPFNDGKTMVQWVMKSYQEMGAEKGARIQAVLTGLGYTNINEVRPESYGELFRQVEALKS